MNICIIIPAHNEQSRIARTVQEYVQHFSRSNHRVHLLIVLNACNDRSADIVQELQNTYAAIWYINLKPGGKGFAIAQGFKHALQKEYELIGFVDADMATSPCAFDTLIHELDGYDGIIASRYMKGAIVSPPRPFIKRWGSKLVYEPIIRFLFGITYHDYQCGAKLFKRKVIEKIARQLVVQHWAFDVEILYLCKKYGFKIKEVPTIWHDQADSKLQMMRSGLTMLKTLFWLRLYHSRFKKWVM